MTITRKLEPLGNNLGPQDMRPNELWYLHDTTTVLTHWNGAKFHPNRTVVMAGEPWPFKPNEISRVIGDIPNLGYLVEPTTIEFLHGGELAGGAIQIPEGAPFGLCLRYCSKVVVWGMQVVGNKATQVPSQNYGIQLVCCRDCEVSNCQLSDCQIGIDFEAGNGHVQDCFFERNGYDIACGHGLGEGPYSYGGGDEPSVRVGANGWPVKSALIEGDRVRVFVS